jgi:hypothetical protein
VRLIMQHAHDENNTPNPYAVNWQAFRMRLNRVRWNRMRALLPPHLKTDSVEHTT